MNWGRVFKYLGLVSAAKARASALDVKIERVRKIVQRQQADITKKMEQLDGLEDRLVQARNALRTSEISNQRLNETISALQEELRTTKEITIPGLVAANELLTRRWEAQTQVEVMKAATMTGDMGNASN
jgi:chromosome segregation ATPase